MFPTDTRPILVNVVFFIDLPPRIEDSAGWRLFQMPQKVFD
jgi:hypothetical protein